MVGIILVLLALAPTGLAATVNVAPGSSIQDAIDAASDGDTIVIASGTYEENLDVEKRVKLVGSGATRPEINGIEIYAAGVEVDGLNITSSGIDVYSSNNVIKNCIITDCYYGIDLDGTYNTTIDSCNFTQCNYALYFSDATYCTITRNNFSANTRAIYFSGGGAYAYEVSSYYVSGNSNNRIYLNYFMDNDNQVYSYVTGNYWNSAAKQNYQYKGVTYNNYTGNYWLNYWGSDKDKDGIGDTPMIINEESGVMDNYPMMLDLPLPPRASFTTNVKIGYAPLGVEFTDLSPFEPTEWQWSFGDGTPNSTEQNPVHVYVAPGVYTVNLTVKNAYGQSSINKDRFIGAIQPLPDTLWLNWTKVFAVDSSSESNGYRVVRAPDGGFAISGDISQSWYFSGPRLIKTLPNGTVEWNKTYGTAGNGHGYDLALAEDGGYVMAGTNSSGNIVVIRTFANGTVNWTVTLADTNGNEAGITATSDGGFVVTGARSFYRNYGGWSGYGWVSNVYLAKLGANGTLSWEKTMAGGYLNLGWQTYWVVSYGHAVRQTTDGGYLVAGTTDPKGLGSDMLLIKTDSSGNPVWTKGYGPEGMSQSGAAVVETPDGGYAIAGTTYSNGFSRVWLVKTLDDGTEQWNKTYSGYGHCEGYSLMVTGDNGYLIGAETGAPDGYNHPYLVKADSSGNTQWETALLVSTSGAISVAPAGGDSLVVGGSIYEGEHRDAFLARITSGTMPVSPVASFVANNTTNIVPMSVQFTDQSTGFASSWSWNFGDGGSSTERNPVHTYATPGTYTVSLTAINDNGSNVMTRAAYIKVVAPPAPVADFTANVTEGDSPLCVKFTDLSSDNATAWSWDFGDGATSTEQNPVHTYSAKGYYTVSLSASNGYTAGTRTRPQYIAARGPNLYLSMSAPGFVERGQTMYYNIYVSNWGDGNASDVVVSAVLPPLVDYVSHQTYVGTFSYDPGTKEITWDLGKVNRWGGGYLTVQVQAQSGLSTGTVISSTAVVTTTSALPSSANTVATAITTVTQSTLPDNAGLSPVRSSAGTVPTIYWSEPVTFTYDTGTDVTGVDISIRLNDQNGEYINSSMAGGPTHWTYTRQFYPDHGSTTVTYFVHYANLSTGIVSFIIYIDPSGYVYDAATGVRIQGATVWLQWYNITTLAWENVPVGNATANMLPDVNPQTTDSAGGYGWDTLAGTYRVHVEATGYVPKDSVPVTVPPPELNLSVGLTKIADPAAPTTTVTLQGSAGNNGWYTSNVQATLSAVDNAGGSGVNRIEYSYDNSVWVTYSGPLSYTSEGVRTLYYRAIDNANNVETTKAQAIKIDISAPIISGAISAAPNANGWFNSNATVHFSASDSVSGIASVTPDVLVSANGAGQSVVGVACDAAGNSASTTVGSINLDRTKPVVSGIVLPASIVPGTTFNASAGLTEMNLQQAVWEWGDSTTSNGTVAGNAISGSHTYSVAGTYTVRLTVTDIAGNSGNATATAIVAAVTPVPTASPTPIPTAPASATPVPAPSFLLVSLTLIGGAMIVAGMRKKYN